MVFDVNEHVALGRDAHERPTRERQGRHVERSRDRRLDRVAQRRFVGRRAAPREIDEREGRRRARLHVLVRNAVTRRKGRAERLVSANDLVERASQRVDVERADERERRLELVRAVERIEIL